MSVVGERVRSAGRPRSMETHQAILQAAMHVLEQGHYRDVSVERIASSAGVGKQTIYRWYDSKADLLLDAFLARYTESLPPMMAGGEPLVNFRAYLHRLVELLPSPAMERGYRALFAEAQFERAFRERVGEFVLQRRRDFARGFVLAAIHKGLIREGVDPDLVVDMILSPIMFKFLATVTPPDQAFVDSVFDTVIAAVAPVKVSAPVKGA
ncbi:TetR/AcrR family transcriptional regulator [Labrys monachus]|uniref:AcrR family transcriptional regulator n=1 Tax=Labrys monachus TaxID=217067 RepID=A0ABU0FP03_9HYPH|nr:TetR/AcrR family transcriptional regulator [Labrys monachus]MDQ0396261.1 AcrR family transcriptional regulator [Labrys monachus]